MRAFGAFGVFCFHFLGTTNPSWLHGIVSDWRTQLGPQCVAIFFVMSGFLLFRPYVAAFVDGTPQARSRPYALRRAVRVLPGYWFALIGCIVLFGVASVRGITDVVVLFGLTQNYREGSALIGLGVTWTLVVEVAFYVVLPLLVALLYGVTPKRAGERTRLWVAVAAIVAVEIGALAMRAWVLWADPQSVRGLGAWFTIATMKWWLLWHWDAFAGGMLLALVVTVSTRAGERSRFVERCTRTAGPAFVTALVLYAVLSAMHRGQKGNTIVVGHVYGGYLLQTLIAVLVVVPAIIGPPNRGIARRLLQHRLVVWFGSLSFGFYLWHLTIVRRVDRWADAGSLPSGLAARFVVTFVLSLVAAVSSWYLIERPLIARVRRVTATAR